MNRGRQLGRDWRQIVSSCFICSFPKDPHGWGTGSHGHVGSFLFVVN